jgi:hypothetical protein
MTRHLESLPEPVLRAYPKNSWPGSHARLPAAWEPPLLTFRLPAAWEPPLLTFRIGTKNQKQVYLAVIRYARELLLL